jgi:alkanesulfonate monooxygenase SsuD/methylene tetrahydromethanopterin reductase-like flavin-dependent oxidoreductase (luciferase family)
LQEANKRIDQLAEQAGRDPASIMRASSVSLDDIETAKRHVAKWVETGYGYLVCGWPEAGAQQVERFARDVMADFSSADTSG